MLNRNIKILFRGLWRKRSFSALNITGLAIGIAAALLIFLLIRYELSIDKFHKNRDRIYRVVSTETFRNGLVDYDGCAPLPLADALRREFPQAEKVASAWKIGNADFAIANPAGGEEKNFRTAGVYFADPSLFGIFDFPWIAGNPQTALTETHQMAITRTVAATWFGRWQEAPGKTVRLGSDSGPYRITGVMEDLPANTDIPLNVVLSFATLRAIQGKAMSDPLNWDNFNYGSQCFFLLGKGQSISSMNALLPDFVHAHYTPLFANSDTRDSSYFQPLREMHFDKKFSRYGNDGWSYTDLWSMGLIALFLLVVAGINFINLSTAQSLGRAKEIGVRKVLGSNRAQLFARFLAETAVLVFLAMLLGFILARLFLPALKQLLQRPLSAELLFSPSAFFFLFATGIGLTLLSGSYPALVISRFDPVAAIKSKINTSSVSGISLRRSLIVLQFVIAQLLIIGTLVIVSQMDYFRNRPMGFDRKAVTLVSLPGGKQNTQQYAYFKRRVLQIPGVLNASLCGDAPSTNGYWQTNFTFENHSHPEDFEIVMRPADSGYLSTFHIGMVAGRFPYASDSSIREVVMNENAAIRLGFKNPADIIGHFIRMTFQKNQPMYIVGVVRNFNSGPLRESMKPVLLFNASDNFSTLAVRLDPVQMSSGLRGLQSVFGQTFPGQFFDSAFFDDTVVNFYHAEAIASILFRIFAALAIFISCLGLYGLVSFMAVQKTKEVGIRKVLGASVRNIVFIFSKEFTMLVGVAFLISAPLGYYFMRQWLSGFYYHIPLGISFFVLAIFLSTGIAWITVGYKAVKSAIANPARSLRSE